MSEQVVKRYVHCGDYCGPECGHVEDMDGEWIYATDYDVLHAEAEALRVALLGIASVNPSERGIEWAKSHASDGLKGAGSELYARWLDTFKEAEALRAENGRHKRDIDYVQENLTAAHAERVQLRQELEAARGLLEQRIPCDVMLPPATTIKRGCPLSTVLASMKLREDFAPNKRVFTATQAPEVPDHTAEASKMVEQGAITVERDFVGTMHIKVGDFDAVQVRYQYPYTDNASTRRLAERIADMLRNPQAEQGERQEAVAWMLADAVGGSALEFQEDDLYDLQRRYGGQIVPLYTAPQPGPDVRALVSADDVRDACANAVSVFAEEPTADQCREVAEYMREVLLAQIARRQAQRQA